MGGGKSGRAYSHLDFMGLDDTSSSELEISIMPVIYACERLAFNTGHESGAARLVIRIE